MTAGFLVRPGEGDSVWSIGRFTRKVGGGDSAYRLAILEAVVTRTSEPRRHIHHREVPATSDEPPAGLSLPAPEVVRPVAERYGIEIVGPPIRAAEAPPT